jgi:hypothetical protein
MLVHKRKGFKKYDDDDDDDDDDAFGDIVFKLWTSCLVKGEYADVGSIVTNFPAKYRHSLTYTV